MRGVIGRRRKAHLLRPLLLLLTPTSRLILRSGLALAGLLLLLRLRTRLLLAGLLLWLLG
jgi:hypothetical protein